MRRAIRIPAGVTAVALAGLLLHPGAASARALELPFEPGEELAYTVRYLGVSVGKLDVAVEEKRDGDRYYWPLRVEGRTKGVFRTLHPVEHHFASHFDPQTGRATGSELWMREKGDVRIEQVKLNGDSAHVRVETRNGVTEQTREIPDGAQDVLAAIYHLRSLPMEKGMILTVPVFTGRKSFTLSARIIGRERVKSDAGDYYALVLLCRTHFDGKFASNRDIRVWISDDENRVPVRMEADFAVGTLRASLTSYKPGLIAER